MVNNAVANEQSDVTFLKDAILTCATRSLELDEATRIFDFLMKGKGDSIQIAAFLTALAMRGESVSEITAATVMMRQYGHKISAPKGAIDIVGTGGDGKGTLNISTAAMIVTAAAGVPVAKHGNRAATSQCGSADLLEACGVNLTRPPQDVENILRDTGVAFMMAPIFHPALKHIAPVRRLIGLQTVFNLLGPLTNPAEVDTLLIGVSDSKWQLPFAKVLQNLERERAGCQRAWIIHGHDGSDELSLSGENQIVKLEKQKISTFTLHPEDAGFAPRVAKIAGEDATYNMQVFLGLLDGEQSDFRDSVVLNSAAALMVSCKVKNIMEGVEISKETIDSKAARELFDTYIEATNRVDTTDVY
jgi:anthranilate phosphoribosyltransferase